MPTPPTLVLGFVSVSASAFVPVLVLVLM
jgi:hypothetical protein